MSYDEIYSLLYTLAPQLADKVSSVEDVSVNLFITGGSPGTISAKVSGGILTISNEALQECDASVSASSEDISALITGKLNPALAMLTGKIKVSGNVSKLMSIMNSFR